MALTLTYTPPKPDEIDLQNRRVRDIIAMAATGAINDVADYIKQTGRANIKVAGFSQKWQNALRANVYPSQGKALDPACQAYHKIPYAGVFEDGAQIAGSPYLWLPLPGIPKSVGGKHMSPANFIAMIGPLHLIIVAGKPPMLAAYMQGNDASKVSIAKLVSGARMIKQNPARLQSLRSGLVSVPMFIGLNSVTLAKKFDLQNVFNRAAAKIPEFYQKHLKVR